MRLLQVILIVGLVAAVWWGWDNRNDAKALADYASMLESENDSLSTRIFTLGDEVYEVKTINGRRLDEIDELSKQLVDLQLKLDSVSDIEVTPDTVYVEGIADTVTIDNQKVYNMHQENNNYTVNGWLKHPSGEYRLNILQEPFKLQLRQVTSPTGRPQMVANIVGRDDLEISAIDFQSSVVKEDESLWRLGPAVSVIDGGFGYGVSLNRGNLSVSATTKAISLGYGLLGL